MSHPCNTKPARVGHPGKEQNQNRFSALRISHPLPVLSGSDYSPFDPTQLEFHSGTM